VSTPTEAIREQLMANNTEYQRLSEEHSLYASQLQQLSSKPHLTDQEQMEEVRLKKLKLRAKDRMEMLVRQSQAA
jgi:uncharacterized protein YdcH (DUF465 family)